MRVLHSVLLSSVVAVFGFSSSVVAQDDGSGRGSGKNSASSGSLELESYATKKVDPYPETQDHAIAWAKAVQSSMSSQSTPPKLVEADAQFLNAAYLLCAVNAGVCPAFLDLVLESDLMTSRLTGKVSCDNSLTFWRSWIALEMDKRHSFLVKTVHMNETSDFRSKVRPRYIKCEETIKGELDMMKGTPQSSLKARYSAEAEVTQSINESVKALNTIKESIPNLFIKLGIRR